MNITWSLFSVASININGMARQERDMGGYVSETLAAVIVQTDITAAQEIPEIPNTSTLKQKLPNTYQYFVMEQLAFFYKKTDLILEHWAKLEKPQGKTFGLYGRFRVSQLDIQYINN